MFMIIIIKTKFWLKREEEISKNCNVNVYSLIVFFIFLFIIGLKCHCKLKNNRLKTMNLLTSRNLMKFKTIPNIYQLIYNTSTKKI